MGGGSIVGSYSTWGRRTRPIPHSMAFRENLPSDGVFSGALGTADIVLRGESVAENGVVPG